MALTASSRRAVISPLTEVKQSRSPVVLTGDRDPNVWSGRALQEGFVDLALSGLASMYPASDWSCCAPGHHGYQRACDLISGQASTGPFGSPVFACAGKTDPPSLRYPLADLGGITLVRYGIVLLVAHFLCSSRWPFLRPDLRIVDGDARRAVKAGRRAGLHGSPFQATP